MERKMLMNTDYYIDTGIAVFKRPSLAAALRTGMNEVGPAGHFRVIEDQAPLPVTKSTTYTYEGAAMTLDTLTGSAR